MADLFVSTLTPTPAAGNRIPFEHMRDVFANTKALRDGYWSQVELSTTGTTNNHNPAAGAHIIWTGASAWTVTGLVPNQDNEVRIYHNASAGSALKFTHQDGGSTAANRFILTAAVQWIGLGGTIAFRYDGTADRWRVLWIEPGKPLTPTFAAGDYIANGSMTWTVASGDVTVCQYQQRGNRVKIDLAVVTSTVGGTPNTALQRIIPGGFTATKEQNNIIRVIDNGTSGAGIVRIVGSASPLMEFYLLAGGNWAASTNNSAVQMQSLEIEVD